MTGRVIHFEVPYDDPERAKQFYREAFDWEIADEGHHYALVRTGAVNQAGFPAEPGYISGAMVHRESPSDRPVITIEVSDIEQALTKIVELGGMVVLGRQEVGSGRGWAAYFKDVEGNLMGLWQAKIAE